MRVIALPEIGPSFTTGEVFLADGHNHQPLDAKEGSLRIVIPGDKKMARWVRQVIALKIVARPVTMGRTPVERDD